MSVSTEQRDGIAMFEQAIDEVKRLVETGYIEEHEISFEADRFVPEYDKPLSLMTMFTGGLSCSGIDGEDVSVAWQNSETASGFMRAAIISAIECRVYADLDL